jgi:predicted ATPase
MFTLSDFQVGIGLLLACASALVLSAVAVTLVSLARTDPVVYVIEDVHWIDEVSESMFADFLTRR